MTIVDLRLTYAWRNLQGQRSLNFYKIYPIANSCQQLGRFLKLLRILNAFAPATGAIPPLNQAPPPPLPLQNP